MTAIRSSCEYSGTATSQFLIGVDMVCCIAAVAVLAVLTRLIAAPAAYSSGLRGRNRDAATLPTARYTARHHEMSEAIL
ncbi:hypothetical protein BJF84_06200 [Rhodococcus sp. CUA-806]|nr:hypothetical protein BJF84_06200 [Rhodococcus sp. CUA-806]